jgi:hypothetical protein
MGPFERSIVPSVPLVPSVGTSDTAWIVGIDLAWGDKKPDGLCLIRADRQSAEIVETARINRFMPQKEISELGRGAAG